MIYAMNLVLVKTKPQPKHGRPNSYYVLRGAYWDKEAKAQRQAYVAYLGVRPVLAESKAEAICKAKGLTLAQLQAVNGLQIVPDAEAPTDGRRRRSKPKDAAKSHPAAASEASSTPPASAKNRGTATKEVTGARVSGKNPAVGINPQFTWADLPRHDQSRLETICVGAEWERYGLTPEERQAVLRKEAGTLLALAFAKWKAREGE